jgi:small subunit ribosomal protein S5
MRAVFEALGVQDIVSKSVGSGNYHNMIRATFTALRKITHPRVIAAKLDKKLVDILGRRNINSRGRGAPNDETTRGAE